MKIILPLLLFTITLCYTVPECKEPERPLAIKCVPKKNVDKNLIGISFIEPYYECTKSECNYTSTKFEECRKEENEVDILKARYVDTLCMSVSSYGPIKLGRMQDQARKAYLKASIHFKNKLPKYNA